MQKSDILHQLRAWLAAQGLHAFLVPSSDAFLSEYVPECDRRLAWLSGFTGSAGMALVTPGHAVLFTDGRYTLQAATELDNACWTVVNNTQTSLPEWLNANLTSGSTVGYDAQLVSLAERTRWQRETPTIQWQATAQNPVDMLWQEGRPPLSHGPLRLHPLAYAGVEAEGKRRILAAKLVEKHADVALIAAADEVMWLLNLRGDDIPMTPVARCHALLHKDATVTLLLAPDRLSHEVRGALGAEVGVAAPELLEIVLSRLLPTSSEKPTLWLDPASTPASLADAVTKAGLKTLEAPSPCLLARACKNPVEIAGMKAAHIRDGAAVTRFLHWLDEALARGETVTELTAMDRLETFRAGNEHYAGPSFTTIAGAGPNGAIVHYRASDATNRRIGQEPLLLLDSGGQYPDGTTDITRTLATGTPTATMRRHVTLVMKGHIALARAVFPTGTSGSQLDALARRPLWQEGLDYDHGTGHGVGSYLSVHEGPQRIGKRGGDTALRPGMVLSNEPGCYREGEYGIRIESLVLVVEKPEIGPLSLGFETLTVAPIDPRTLDFSLFTPQERAWLEAYHRRVLETLTPLLPPETARWLSTHCEPYFTK